MNYADVLAEMLQDGVDALWRNIRAMPEDKLDWKPAPDSRTARQLLEEIVSVTPYSTELIRTMKSPEMESKEMPKDLDGLEAQYKDSIKDLVVAIREFPAEKLHDTIDLPWGKQTFLQSVSYPYWNLMYHMGQIAYIQTMYGDKQSH